MRILLVEVENLKLAQEGRAIQNNWPKSPTSNGEFMTCFLDEVQIQLENINLENGNSEENQYRLWQALAYLQGVLDLVDGNTTPVPLDELVG
ncbi:hypothetical protein ADN00_15600 [Ornatilinea apprima]|uniref:Uncharacterized protein n=1 Tax=Ornatilinea apprima TaxID=1134406 RepID=A0A0P6WZK0_9CHLR|nr:hypothetical protein [Ornatilinea apprima]KPL72241.1 hypothetical protein ADN00_15600 [Ornatilinea apprima]